MNRLEILAKIDECGGEWKPIEGVSMKRYEDGDTMGAVRAEVTVEEAVVEFTLWNHVDEPYHFSANTHRLDNLQRVMNAARLLATAIDYKMPDDVSMPKVVERMVEKQAVLDRSEEHRLGGMVSAYEKLLMGRDVTISK